MDKKIKSLIFSVVLTVLIVAISIPLWSSSKGNHGFQMADALSNPSINVTIGEFPSLIIIEDSRAKDYIAPTTITLKNTQDTQHSFDFLLLIDKKSTIPYMNMHLLIDDTLVSLDKLETIEDDKNIYFILNSYTLKSFEQKELSIRLWLTPSTKDIPENASLTANFLIR